MVRSPLAATHLSMAPPLTAVWPVSQSCGRPPAFCALYLVVSIRKGSRWPSARPLCGLTEDRVAVGEDQRLPVVEAPHAVQRAEVVVEAAVLLHQDDDVLDVVDASVPVWFCGVGRARRPGSHGGGRSGCCGGADEGAAADLSHGEGKSFGSFGVSRGRRTGRR